MDEAVVLEVDVECGTSADDSKPAASRGRSEDLPAVRRRPLGERRILHHTGLVITMREEGKMLLQHPRFDNI
jgi:hypothetical protein